ncbi:glutathione transport system permease protein GsiD [Abditibacteriota bacterium]|nr:glutathione transport system permease protein GsiD [Abditibacteriota bacterium]
MNDTHSEEIIPGASHEGQLIASPHGVSTVEDSGRRKASRQWLTGRASRGLDPKKFDSVSPAGLAWRELKKNRLAMIGLWTLVVLYTIAIFGQFIAPYDSTSQNPGGVQTAFQPPMKLRWSDQGGVFHWRPFVYQTQQTLQGGAFSYLPDATQPRTLQFFVHGSPYKFWGFIPTDLHLFGVENGAVFLLGTDGESRDYFSRLLFGSMISLSVGFIAIGISFTLGLLVGGISGFYGGRTDDIIMRVCEIIMSVPDFYLLLALAAALPADLNPIVSYLLITSILSFIGWAGMARIIRGMVLSVREREYVEAGRALGLSDLQIIVRHILPSTFTYAIVAATMSVPGYILAEAGLSFLGLGIRDPVASWGNMLTQAQNQTTLFNQRWILTPGLAIFITTLAFNFLGDGLRDALDPRSRRLG